MNNQNESLRLARIEAIANKQRAELPDVQQAALAAAIEAGDADTAATIARAIRDRMLAASDAEVAIDRLGLGVPTGTTFSAWLDFLRSMAGAINGAWTAYRQALRDLPTQEGFPLAIVWPSAPGSADADEQELTP